MAHDEELAERVRDLLGGAAEQRMFGGLAFLVEGRMAVCVSGRGGLLLAAPDAGQAATWTGIDGVEAMQMGARRSDTWVHVAPPALATDDALATWVGRGLAAARTRTTR